MRYGKVHEVSPADLRPWWQRDDAGDWVFTLAKRARTLDQWRATLMIAQFKVRMAYRVCGRNGCTLINVGGYAHPGLCRPPVPTGSKRPREPAQPFRLQPESSPRSSEERTRRPPAQEEARSGASGRRHHGKKKQRGAYTSAPGRALDADESDPEAERWCAVCHDGAWNEPGFNLRGEWIEGNWILFCDGEQRYGCKNAYHTLCLEPPLLAVPEGDWFCPVCVARQAAMAPAMAPATTPAMAPATTSAMAPATDVALAMDDQDVEEWTAAMDDRDIEESEGSVPFSAHPLPAWRIEEVD